MFDLPYHFRRFKQLLRMEPPHRVTAPPQLRMIRLFESEPITLASLNRAYRVIGYSAEYRQKWIDLLNSNNDLGYWDNDRFTNELLANMVPDSEILVLDGEKLFGACTAFRLALYEPYAVLAYPIVQTSYRNKGVGTFLISQTLFRCQQAGFPGIILHTDDFRTHAIQAYLKLGFVPDLETSPETRERWQNFLDALDISRKM